MKGRFLQFELPVQMLSVVQDQTNDHFSNLSHYFSQEPSQYKKSQLLHVLMSGLMLLVKLLLLSQ